MWAPSPRVAQVLHFYCGVLAAALLSFAALLGLRKRLLRVRLGSMSAWAAAHNWLGASALVLGLIHAHFRIGSTISALLVVGLTLTVVTGIIGMAIQAVVPRLLTSRFADESPLDDFEPLFVEHWQDVKDVIARGSAGREPAEEGRALLERFHDDTLAPFFARPLSQSTPLAHEAEASLAFDALRGSVDAGLHEAVDRIRQIVSEARLRAEEGRHRRTLQVWLPVHIAAAVVTLALVIAHALAATYY
jgi:hypothetical protein